MAREREGPEVTTERDVPATMRDGTVLRADVYRPEGDGPFPVLLTRTPYDKAEAGATLARLAQAGYLVVSQDIRGRCASDGEFLPLHRFGSRDVEDGFDTVEWAARLPGANGGVGMFGTSYAAWTGWKAAASRPPSLRCMYVSGISLRHNDVEGVFRPGRRLEWSLVRTGPDSRRRTPGAPGPYTFQEAQKLWEVERHKWIWLLPRRDLPDALQPAMARCYHRMFQHPGEDYFEFEGIHRHIDIPVLHRTGWYDRFVRAVDHFGEMVSKAPSQRARSSQRLIVGPWGHTNQLCRVQGEADFGPEAEWDNDALAIRWFDSWLKGIDNGVSEDAPVRLFVMGENRWREETHWPPQGVVPTEFFLDSRGHANTPAGDGLLTRQPAADRAPDTHVYDPRDPVPSLFLPNCQDGPFDQRPLDHRADVLVYATEPLTEPVEVIGFPVVKLSAATSARDTDFTAKLVDVAPDGLACNLCYGIVRARFRNGWDRPALVTPGEVVEYTIQMNPTGNKFLPGHRIRLDISSSDFPNFERNYNTGGDGYTETEVVTARQTVHHSAEHPSRIVLPVVSRP